MEREYRTPHSPVGNTRESNVMLKRPKMTRYDVYTYQGRQYKHECGFMKQMF